MKPKKILFITIIISILILILTEPQFSIINSGVSYQFENNILVPLFFTLIGYAASNFVLLFFSREVFKLWLRNIASWFLPASIIILISSSASSSGVVSFDRADYALFLAVTLVILTLMFSLAHKFYYKK